MYSPEKPAPITSASKRGAASSTVAADLLDGPGQVQRLDSPGAVLLFVGLVIVTGTVQFVAVAEDDPVVHRPDPAGGHRRGEGDLRGMAMVHGGRILETGQHHGHEG